MGHYPHQDFYYGYLCKIPDEEEKLETIREEIPSYDETDRFVGFQRSGDLGRTPLPRGVIGVKINDSFRSKDVVMDTPKRRDQYGTDMAYLGGYHVGEFDFEQFKDEIDEARDEFEEHRLKETLENLECVELQIAQPTVVTVSWYG